VTKPFIQSSFSRCNSTQKEGGWHDKPFENIHDVFRKPVCSGPLVPTALDDTQT